MISYQAILVEIEKHIQQAKIASTEQQMREALVATKALCDVVLSVNKQDMKSILHNDEPMPTGQLQLVESSQRLEEDGANGASIFDF